MIPHTLHRIWLGSPVPPEVEAAWQTWTMRHPGWEHRTWTDDDVPALVNQAVFDAATTFAQKADVLRYEILLRHGGVYVDTDMECFRPLDDLIDGLDFFAGIQSGTTVAIGIIGATPGHRALRATVERLAPSYAARRRVSIPWQTGPEFFTEAIHSSPDLLTPASRIFDPAYFYPYLPGETLPTWRRGTAYAAHHWHGSWTAHERERPAARIAAGALGVRGSALAGRLAADVVRRRAARRLRDGIREINDTVRDAARRAGWVAAPPPVVAPAGPDRLLVHTRHGFPLHVMADDLTITPHLVAHGSYEGNVVESLTGLVSPGATVVDVGANVGLYTVALGRLVGSTGRVVSYECNRDLVGVLRDNIAMNYLSERVEVIDRAAGARSGAATFHRPARHHGLGSVVQIAAAIEHDVITQTVPIETLDGRLHAVGEVALLKIDVEGGELDVLSGARDLFAAGRIRAVLLEVLPDTLGPAYLGLRRWFTAAAAAGATFHVVDEAARWHERSPADVLAIGAFNALLVRIPEGRPLRWTTLDERIPTSSEPVAEPACDQVATATG